MKGGAVIASTNVTGASASTLLTTEGLTTFHYYATDVAGNVDVLIDRAHQEVDDTKRLALLKEIQMQILQQVPVVPLPSPAGTWVHNPRLEIGFPVNAFMGTFTLGRASVRQ